MYRRGRGAQGKARDVSGIYIQLTLAGTWSRRDEGVTISHRYRTCRITWVWTGVLFIKVKRYKNYAAYNNYNDVAACVRADGIIRSLSHTLRGLNTASACIWVCLQTDLSFPLPITTAITIFIWSNYSTSYHKMLNNLRRSMRRFKTRNISITYQWRYVIHSNFPRG